MNSYEATLDDFEEKMIEGFKAPFPGESDPTFMSSTENNELQVDQDPEIQINNLPNRPIALHDEEKDSQIISKPKTNKQSRRYHELYRKANLAEQERNQLAAKLNEAYTLLEAEKRKTREQENKSHEYFESLQNTNEERLLEKSKQAKIAGDIDAETEANLALMKIQANKSTFDLYKYHKQREEEESQNQQHYNNNDIIEYPIETPIDNYDDSMVDDGASDESADYISNVWYPQNRWANPNDPLYNESLTAEAELFIAHRNKERAILGQEFSLQEQLEEVSNAIRAVYLNNSPPQNSGVPTNKTSSVNRYNESRVAAPSGRSSMADLYVNNSPNRGTKMSFSEDQTQAMSDLRRLYPERNMEELKNTFIEAVNKHRNSGNKFLRLGV